MADLLTANVWGRRRGSGLGLSPEPWHPDRPDGCASCKRTVRPHLANGLCVDCYRAAHGLGERGHEAVPLRRVGGE